MAASENIWSLVHFTASYLTFIPKEKSWNPVFLLLIEIIFLNNLGVKNMLLKMCIFSVFLAMHFLYTLIRPYNLWEKK